MFIALNITNYGLRSTCEALCIVNKIENFTHKLNLYTKPWAQSKVGQQGPLYTPPPGLQKNESNQIAMKVTLFEFFEDFFSSSLPDKPCFVTQFDIEKQNLTKNVTIFSLFFSLLPRIYSTFVTHKHVGNHEDFICEKIR